MIASLPSPSAPDHSADTTAAAVAVAGYTLGRLAADPDLIHRISLLGFFGHTLH
ncbi:hypothetical protein HK101_007296, partial [Irineochytrium annulatum]